MWEPKNHMLLPSILTNSKHKREVLTVEEDRVLHRCSPKQALLRKQLSVQFLVVYFLRDMEASVDIQGS